MDNAGTFGGGVLIGSASGPVTTTHNGPESDIVDRVRHPTNSLGKRLVGVLGGVVSLFKVSRIALGIGLAGAVGWAWDHRAAVQLLPFEAADGAAVSRRLARALDDVALGSTSGILVDKTLRLDDDNGPPPISIPGTGVSLASLVSMVQIGPLAPTRVSGALVAHDNTYHVWMEVFGWSVGQKVVRTDSVKDPDQALVQAAEQLYGLFRPIVLASYLYSRDSKRCLEVIGDIVSDPSASTQDKAEAHHLWGLLLRDQQDFEGARAEFNDAIDLISSAAPAARRSKAQAWVDIGHTFLWEQRWHEAAAAYERSAHLDGPEADDRWAVPHNFRGDALRESGDMRDAIQEYHEAIRLDRHYVDPWNGLGRTYAGQGQYTDAIADYIAAHRLHLRLDRTAASTYYGLGDVLFKLGCSDTASALYGRALEIDPSFQEEQATAYDWGSTHTCQLRRPSEDSAMCLRCPATGVAAPRDALSVRMDSNELSPLEALLVNVSRAG